MEYSPTARKTSYFLHNKYYTYVNGEQTVKYQGEPYKSVCSVTHTDIYVIMRHFL